MPYLRRRTTKAPTGIFSDLPDALLQQGSLLPGIYPGQTGRPPRREAGDFLKAYTESPWLRAIVGRISETAAGVCYQAVVPGQPSADGTRFVVGGRRFAKTVNRLDRSARQRVVRQALADQEAVELVDHPLVDLIEQPCPFFDGLSVRMLVHVYLDTVGECFLWKQRETEVGPPTQLWPIPAHWVRETPTPARQSFRIQWGAFKSTIPATEMLWLRTLDPWDPYGRGVGQANAIADELDADEATAKHVAAYFYNSARPDFLIYNTGLGPEETKRAQTDWLNRLRGAARAWMPFFFSRDVKIHEFENDIGSQKVVELRQFERDACMQVYGMSPEILGVLTNSNRSTIDASDYLLMSKLIVPRVERVRSQLQTWLVPEFDDRIVLEYENPVREDVAQRIQAATAAPWSITVDEWRELSGHEELPDGSGQVFARPIALTFVPSLMDLQEMPGSGDPNADASTSEASSSTDAASSESASSSEMPVDASASMPMFKSIKDQADAMSALAASLEPKTYRLLLQLVARTQHATVEEAIRSALAVRHIDHAVGAIAWAEWTNAFQDVTQSLIAAAQAAGKTSAQEVSVSIGTDVTFRVDHPRAVAWARESSAELVRNVTAETRAAIREIVSQAIDQGWGVDGAAKQIRSVVGLNRQQVGRVSKFRSALVDQGVSEAQITRRVGAMSRALVKKRSALIARTEIASSVSAGQQEAWDQAVESGQLDKKTTRRQWLVTEDDRLDTTICEPMDGQVRALDQPFTSGVGAAVGRPPAHPGCRCTVGLTFQKS